jgi:AcrR family transcriptional regulator
MTGESEKCIHSFDFKIRGRNKMNLKEKKKKQVEQMMREEICNAIRRLMKHMSYKDMKVEDIAKEVGVSKGTLYNYFSSKEDLVKYFLEKKSAEYEVRLDRLISLKMSSAREKMVKYLELVFSFADDNEGWAKLFFEYMQEHASLEEERTLCLSRMQTRQMAIIQEGVAGESWNTKKLEVKSWLMALLVMKTTYMLVVDKEHCPPVEEIIEAMIDSIDLSIGK